MQEHVKDWIGSHAAWMPEKVAMEDIRSRRRFTYAAMNDRCSRLAAFLAERYGVGPGARVAILAHNSTDIFEVQFACMKLGAIFVPLNWRLAAAEIMDILAHAEPALLLYGHEFREVAQAALAAGRVPAAIGMANGAPSDYEAGIAHCAPVVAVSRRTMDDPWMILYTSGTTGRPKGVLLTYRMATFSAMHGMLKARVSEDACNLAFLPLFHVGGLFLMANMVFHAGGRNIVMERFDAADALAALDDPALGITHAFGVPANFLMMAQEPGFAASDLSRLHCLLVGGAPSPLTLLEAYARKGAPLQQAWGMTETTSMGTGLPSADAAARLGSVGKPLPYIELAILDESGQAVRPGEVGELAARGPTVSPGYWRAPEETASAFRDGWFLTGDAAREDGQGFLYIVDRRKDMYISGGENVYPAEIENVLHRMGGVVEAAVVGVPDERWGEVGCAWLHLDRPGITEQQILDHCAAHLARFKLPRHVRIVAELPHTAAGKVAKTELRKWFANRVAASATDTA